MTQKTPSWRIPTSLSFVISIVRRNYMYTTLWKFLLFCSMKINYQPIKNFFFSQYKTQKNFVLNDFNPPKNYNYYTSSQNLNKERSLHFSLYLWGVNWIISSVWKSCSFGRFVIYHLFKWVSNHAGTPALVEVLLNSTISNRFWLTPSLLKRAQNILGNPANWKQSIKHDLVLTSSVSNALTEKSWKSVLLVHLTKFS